MIDNEINYYNELTVSRYISMLWHQDMWALNVITYQAKISFKIGNINDNLAVIYGNDMLYFTSYCKLSIICFVQLFKSEHTIMLSIFRPLFTKSYSALFITLVSLYLLKHNLK